MKSKIFIVALIGVCAFMYGCGNNAKEKKAMEPEEVVEAFSRAVAAGEFQTACSLCDTVSMKEYIEDYAEVWKELQEKDSSALAIAASILSESSFEVNEIKKAGEDRNICYSIEASGYRKERMATVRKEEGEWKVLAITDVI